MPEEEAEPEVQPGESPNTADVQVSIASHEVSGIKLGEVRCRVFAKPIGEVIALDKEILERMPYRLTATVISRTADGLNSFQVPHHIAPLFLPRTNFSVTNFETRCVSRT